MGKKEIDRRKALVLNKDDMFLNHTQIYLGTKTYSELDLEQKKLNSKIKELKQKISTKQHEVDIRIDQSIRKKINSNLIKILLEKAKGSQNEKVQELYMKLRRLNVN